MHGGPATTHTDSNADSNTNSNTDAYGDANAISHGHAQLYSDSARYTDSNADTDTDSNSDANPTIRHANTIAHSMRMTNLATSLLPRLSTIEQRNSRSSKCKDAESHEREKYEGIYASSERYSRYGHSNHGSRALPMVQKWTPASLVDIGCGWNEFCRELRAAQPTINAVGVDFACPGSDVTADATELPFADKEFDVLTAFDVLEHLLPEQVNAALAEFARVSRRFIFSIAYQPSVTKWKGENLHPTVRGETWWILRILSAGGCSIEKRGRYITGLWQPVPKIHHDANVILVGNGPSILDHRGEQIDAFDEVIRFNTYHIDGFERHTGQRTTFWSTFGRGQLPASQQRPDRIIYIHGENGDPAYVPREIYRIPRWFYNETRTHVQRHAWWMGGFENDSSHLLATSGLLVAAWLLQVVGVKQVTLAGFDHFSKEKSRQHHYWLPQAFGKPKEHDGAVEAAMFAGLRDWGRIVYL